MRVYHNRAIRQMVGGVWSVVAPTGTPTAITYTVAGAAVEGPLTAGYDAVRQRWYFDTTAAPYAPATVYYAMWTIVLGGISYAPVDWFTSVSADVVPPGPPGLGAPSVTSNSATFPVVQPTDPDFDHTMIYVLTLTGAFTASGSGAFITVPGLPSSMTFPLSFAVAFDTSGNPSLPAAGCWTGAFTTLPGGIPDRPIAVKFWFGNRATLSASAPRFVNADRVGHFTVGHPAAPLGQGTNMRVRIEIHHPLWVRIAGITARGQTKDGESGGAMSGTRLNDGS